METNGPAMDLLSGLNDMKPLDGWYRGKFSDDEVKILQARTRERQKTAFEALRASGKSLLSTPVKKRDSTSK